ncbi:1635_t:CDS:2, partial [Paraglomus occultum]
EQRYGPPKEIFKKQESDEDLSSSEDAEDDIDYGKINIKKIIKEGVAEEFDENALRKYQLERLKYYYAIVDCDTVKTARAIYEQCDGTEFERSSNFFDLRFVPDGVEFNDVPREVDECYEAPDVYKPIDFTTNVLQHSRAKLTWDADDPDRVRLTRHSFTKDDIDNMDFKIYLASTDEESEGDNDGIKQKYKNLLAEIEEEKEVDEDLEVTFAPALTEVNNEEDDELEETTIEKYLRKQKEKKKLKKAAKEASRQLEIGSD